MVEADTLIPSESSNILILYLDQAGYLFRIPTTAATVSQGVVLVLRCLGLCERSFNPLIPPDPIFLIHLRNVSLWIPNLLDVRLMFLPCSRCQSRIFNLFLVLGVASASLATKAALGSIDPYVVIWIPYLPFMNFSSQVDTIIWTSAAV